MDVLRTRLVDDVLDLLQEPFGGLPPVIGFIVAGVAVTFGVSISAK